MGERSDLIEMPVRRFVCPIFALSGSMSACLRSLVPRLGGPQWKWAAVEVLNDRARRVSITAGTAALQTPQLCCLHARSAPLVFVSDGFS